MELTFDAHTLPPSAISIFVISKREETYESFASMGNRRRMLFLLFGIFWRVFRNEIKLQVVEKFSVAIRLLTNNGGVRQGES